MTAFNFDEAMEAGVDELPALAPRAYLPNGNYILKILEIERKPIKDEDSVIFRYELAEVEALADPSKEAPAVGTKLEEVFNVSTLERVVYLRKHLEKVAAGRKLGQLMVELIDQNVRITSKARAYKDKAGEDQMGWNTASGLQAL